MHFTLHTPPPFYDMFLSVTCLPPPPPPPIPSFAQVKTILSVLLREYHIEMVGELPPPDFEAMVVGPKGKCNVRYTKKTTA